MKNIYYRMEKWSILVNKRKRLFFGAFLVILELPEAIKLQADGEMVWKVLERL